MNLVCFVTGSCTANLMDFVTGSCTTNQINANFLLILLASVIQIPNCYLHSTPITNISAHYLRKLLHTLWYLTVLILIFILGPSLSIEDLDVHFIYALPKA